MNVLMCGFFSATDESVLIPKAPSWSSSVEGWKPDYTNVFLSWEDIVILNSETQLVVTTGKISEELELPTSEKVRHVAICGITTCVLLANNRLLLYKPGIMREVFELTASSGALVKIGCTNVKSRVTEAIDLWGLDDDGLVWRIKFTGKVCKLCAVPCGDDRIIDIQSAREHVLFLAANGHVYSSGLSSRGQLGHGGLDEATDPKLIDSFEDLRIVQISADGWSSMALSEYGLVFMWGWNSAGAIGFPNRAVREQSLAHYSSNSTATVSVCPDPAFVEFLTEPTHLVVPEEISWISCGMRHAGAISVAGNVYIWGLNQHGQLGLGDKLDRDKPVLLTSLQAGDLRVSRLFCGEWTTVFLLDKTCLTMHEETV